MLTLALGAFDGIHLGHASVIRSALSLDADASVACFEPIPRQFFGGRSWNRRLTTPGERRAAIGAAGVHEVLTVPFDAATVSMSPEDFLDTLMLRMPFGRLVVGWDFHFGSGRSGTPARMERWCTSKGVDSMIVVPFEIGGEPVKSGRIRDLLGRGDLQGCRDLLGRCYAAEGPCARGRGAGRELGFPTLNLRVPACKMLPPPGSYAGLVALEDEGEDLPAAVFVHPDGAGGFRGPVEAHVPGRRLDAYGRAAEVSFVARLREPVRSPSTGELRDLIAGDVEKTLELLAGLPGIGRSAPR